MNSVERMLKKIACALFRVPPERLSVVKAGLLLPFRRLMGRPLITNRAALPFLLDLMGLKGKGVEVGVAEGDFSEVLLEYSSLSELTSVDPWKEFGDSEYEDVNNAAQAEQDRRYESTLARLKKFGERSRVLRMMSDEAAGRFPDGSLDFVYIDANHSYEGCRKDMELWWPKLREGGLFAGHDYLEGDLPQGRFGVKRAVDEFAEKSGLKLFVTRDDWPTWYLIK